jgi:hypothetical protein
VTAGDGAEGRRLALLADLELLNHELARMGVAPYISVEAAGLYPADEIPDLIASTRRHLARLARDLA